MRKRNRTGLIILILVALALVVGIILFIIGNTGLFGTSVAPGVTKASALASPTPRQVPSASPLPSETRLLNTATPGVTALASPTPLQSPAASPLASETQAAATAVLGTTGPEIVQIASRPIEIRSVSGDIIGDGTVEVYQPKSVNNTETALVELSLQFDHQYITPTPFGLRTAFPVTRVTSTPPAGQPTPTIYAPEHTETGIDIYQRMGASLECSAQSFSGCDSGYNPTQTRFVSLEGVKWSWILSPKQNVQGGQDLRLQLWTVDQAGDGSEQRGTSVFDYAFQISITSASAAPSLAVPVGILGLCLLLLAGIFMLRGRRGARTATRPPDPRLSKISIFISYRRVASWSLAQKIRDALRDKGFKVFMDVTSLGEGQYSDDLMKAIEDCDFFVVVLSANSLQSDWVIHETKQALKLGKKIIPVLDGFDLSKDSLPDDLAALRNYNAVTITPEYVQAGLDRLIEFLTPKP